MLAVNDFNFNILSTFTLKNHLGNVNILSTFTVKIILERHKEEVVIICYCCDIIL